MKANLVLLLLFFTIACNANIEKRGEFNVNIMTVEQKVSTDSLKELLDAINHNRIEEVRKILKQKPNLNVRDEEGNSPLGTAIPGNLEIAKLLIDAGADPSFESTDIGCANAERCLKKPIESAIKRNNWSAVEFLIDHGANANDGSALAAAVSRDNPTAVKMLLDKKVDINFNKDFGSQGMTPFALSESVEVAKLLADVGADINKADDEGKTPLAHFTEQDKTDLIKFVKGYKAKK